jgi:tRNA pseudouridine13 synthase
MAKQNPLPVLSSRPPEANQSTPDTPGPTPDPPPISPEPPISATIKRAPDDFVVEELPAYPASGEGEHVFITIRKTGLTTPAAAQAIAAALDLDQRGAGHAGLKDRHAITTQTLSFPFPIRRSLDEIESLHVPGIEVLEVKRHGHKLKPGHLRGNRFTIALRDLAPGAAAVITTRLEALALTGAPNAFGPQRFGKYGDNPERALAWLSGRDRGPPQRQAQRLLFSSLQSLLFNRVLERRLADGTATRVLPGDVAKKHDSGALFDVPEEAGAELDDARARADKGEISPTGPMFGIKMRWPSGVPAQIERDVLQDAGCPESRLGELRALGEGTRRALRMEVSDLRTAPLQGDGLSVSFVLPKGGYATTVLACTSRLVDASSFERQPGER